MSDKILEELGLTKEVYADGEAGATIKEFEALDSGVYDGVVKHIIVYKNQWDGTQAQYVVLVEKDGEPKEFKFRQDVGKELKDKTPNKGYAGRLKQFAYATNTELSALSIGKDTKLKVFGKECDGQFLKGMDNKKVKVLLRKSDDTNKEDGEAFKITNDIMGVIAMDGTDAKGELAAEAFEEQIAKTPIFKAPRKVKAGSGDKSTQAKTKSGDAIADVL